MPAQSVVIGEQSFASFSAARDHVRTLLRAYSHGEHISPADFVFMRAVLERHPDAAHKVGVGVSKIFVDRDRRGGRCFYLRRFDDTEDDFSFLQCLGAKNPAADFRAACRTEIQPQIASHKHDRFAAGTGFCDISGVPLDPRNCHVDHEPPRSFVAILADFVELYRIDPANEPTDAFDAKNTAKHLTCVSTRNAWTDYHRAHAKLRLLDPDVHRSLPRR